MFQLSFLNTGLLIFAAATVLPLLIWLLAKRKPRRVIFSSLRFIKLSQEQEKKRAKLKNLLLLIIRMLIILLVVLSVARPMLRSGLLKPSGKHPPTALAIILDTSYSMDRISGTKSLLEHAKERLLELNKLTKSDDRLILITSDEHWNSLHAQILPGKVPPELLQSIKITHLPSSLEELYKLAERKLAETQLPNREIHLLTDLQAQDYPPKTAYPVLMIPLPRVEEPANLSCQAAEPLAQLVERRRSQTISFKLTNYGSAERKDVLVKAVVGGIKLGEKFVSLPARESVTETIQIELQTDGWQNGYIEVLDDRLEADNRSYFAFPFYLNPRVAIISETGSVPAALASILSVYTGSGGLSSTIHPSNLNSAVLKDYSLILLSGIHSFNPRLRELLTSSAAAGKGIIYTIGASLNQDYKAWLQQQFSISLGEYSQSPRSIDFVNQHHYISSLVADRQNSLQSVTDFHPARSRGTANPILSAGGEALMLAGEKSLLLTLDLSSQRSRFLLDPAFPVLMMRSFQYLGAGNPELSKKALGDPVRASALTLPDGQRIELANRSYKLTEPGLYTRFDLVEEALAVDPDYSEGDYRRMDFSGHKTYKQLSRNWKSQIFQSRLGFDLWKYLLIAALLLVLVEIILVKLEEQRPGQPS